MLAAGRQLATARWRPLSLILGRGFSLQLDRIPVNAQSKRIIWVKLPLAEAVRRPPGEFRVVAG
jgi:hypothetical protein